jgi:hypothetical protein
MLNTSKLHDIEVKVGNGTLAALTALGLVAFVALAAASTIYDIGRWLAAW